MLVNVDGPICGFGSRQLVQMEIRINDKVLVRVIQKVYLAVSVANLRAMGNRVSRCLT